MSTISALPVASEPDGGGSRIRTVEWEACIVEPRPSPVHERRLERETGEPGRLIRYVAGSEWVSDATVRLTAELYRPVHLEHQLADQVGLAVSQENSCRYCFGAQRAFLRTMGMKESRIARLEQDLLTGDFTHRERAALRFARRLARSAPLADYDDVQALREAGFANEEIAELVGVVAATSWFNRMSTLLALPPEFLEAYPDRWLSRVTRPFAALKLRSRRTRASTRPLSPEERTGPFSLLVNSLDGLPMAAHLRAILDGMFASDVLSGRTIALVFAVVARSLGCLPSERESTRLLLESGMTPDQVRDVLTHLSSPVLGPMQRRALLLAREAVWYEPAPLQRRCRELTAGFTREQIIELAGAISLANTVCRLGLVNGYCA